MSREKDVFYGGMTRVAGIEKQNFNNTWMSADLEVGAHDHARRGYPWTVSVQHKDDGQSRSYEGLASTRAAAHAQAVLAMTTHVRNAAEAEQEYQRRKAIYNWLSQRDGVPLAEPETVESARARMRVLTSPTPFVADKFGMLSFKQPKV